jgi:CMP-N-acetylneuraminic acid synthetase
LTTETVALIPARGGSKGLPRKNVAELGGKPLIAWTIQAAKRASSIGRVFVTTDDEEIARVSISFGALVIARPESLATDKSRSEDVILHALDVLDEEGSAPSHFALLQPTSPLRDETHIDALIEAARDAGVSCAWSVNEAEHHPFKMLVESDGSLQPVARLADLNAPRQALPPAYRQNGAIYWLSSEGFRTHESFFVPPVHPYLMEPDASIDIDDADDLETVRRILRRR